jgi:hypothetical protein
MKHEAWLDGMKVRLEDVRKALDSVFAGMLENGCTEVELDRDFYLWMQPQAFYSVPEIRQEYVTAGQLSFDLEKIQALAAGEYEGYVPHLSSIAAVLTAIQYELLKKA